MIERTPIHQRQEKINQIKSIVEKSVAQKKRLRNLERFERELSQNRFLSGYQIRHFIDRSKETIDDMQLNQLRAEIQALEEKIERNGNLIASYLKAIQSFDRLDQNSRSYYAEQLASIWMNSKDLEGQVIPFFEKIELEHIKKGGKPWKRMDQKDKDEQKNPVLDESSNPDDIEFQRYLEGKAMLTNSRRNDYLSQIKALEGETKRRKIEAIKKMITDEEKRVNLQNKKNELKQTLHETFQFLTVEDFEKLVGAIESSKDEHQLDKVRKQASQLNEEHRLFITSVEHVSFKITQSHKISEKDKAILRQKLQNAQERSDSIELAQILKEIETLELKGQKKNPAINQGDKKKIKPKVKLKEPLLYSGWQGLEGRSSYRDENLKLVKVQWKTISGSKYYFHENATMIRGWRKIENKWYFFEKSGAMATGWKKDKNKWYYLEPSGMMATGWKRINQKWYYLEPSGSMVTGWKQINQKWYYFESSGAMATGWKKVRRDWYYLESSGSMKTGWKHYKNQWYYLKKSGRMAVGTLTINTTQYHFFTITTMFPFFKEHPPLSFE
ncbi:choline-binding protein [Erysipelothrix piscisicarius]|uniref:Choline-binding protein n=1 Tax=Erysipelothrix piscisicarius TaxID=2485784 RepID=A0A3Q8S2X4_9FIRM|nr:choline-binding protein [Erysipelothrix piscisicarius]AZK44401.1 choline-binding protein [Erysipelothrix piscisicarius]